MDQKKEIKEALEKILGSNITLRNDESDPVDELWEFLLYWAEEMMRP